MPQVGRTRRPSGASRLDGRSVHKDPRWRISFLLKPCRWRRDNPACQMRSLCPKQVSSSARRRSLNLRRLTRYTVPLDTLLALSRHRSKGILSSLVLVMIGCGPLWSGPRSTARAGCAVRGWFEPGCNSAPMPSELLSLSGVGSLTGRSAPRVEPDSRRVARPLGRRSEVQHLFDTRTTNRFLVPRRHSGVADQHLQNLSCPWCRWHHRAAKSVGFGAKRVCLDSPPGQSLTQLKDTTVASGVRQSRRGASRANRRRLTRTMSKWQRHLVETMQRDI